MLVSGIYHPREDCQIGLVHGFKRSIKQRAYIDEDNQREMVPQARPFQDGV